MLLLLLLGVMRGERGGGLTCLTCRAVSEGKKAKKMG